MEDKVLDAKVAPVDVDRRPRPSTACKAGAQDKLASRGGGLLPDVAPDSPTGPRLRGGDALPLSRIVAVTTPAMALAACGGGGGAAPTLVSVTPPPPPPPPPPPAVSEAQASRFLSQTSMGSSRADIASVRSLGLSGWIDAQFTTARATTHWDWLISRGFNDPANINGQAGFDVTMWRQLISGQDQLRQRVTMALLDFLVISIDGLNTQWRAFSAAAFVDILADNAFTNYRTILEQVSLSPAMGLYLTFLGNRRASGNSVPDENYARELMQLFSIGLVRLNTDGTVQTGAGGVPIESYTQEDVSGLARVFTGFSYATNDSTIPDRQRQAMIVNAAQHETGVKTFLGSTIPAGTTGLASLTQALDIIFAHPNVPPFVSKQLIQRLVTSNPSPAYVARISAVFANNGSSVRGDMKAVIKAILTDNEARDASIAAGASFGKLRAPVNRLTGWARGFGVTSPTELWPFGNTTSTSNRLAQSPARSPSVFNFFRPGYTPPSTAISAGGLVAPEFQITTEPTVIAYVNYMQTLIQNGAGEARADYSALTPLAATPATLVDEVDLILGAQLSAATKTTITGAVTAIDGSTAAGTNNRIYTAILLTMASPEFITQK